MPVILGGNTGIYLASLAPAIDPDAQAFITAAAITDPTQQTAINQLVVDLKGYSIWTKFDAIYPMLGGGATAHSYNLKNTANFQLTFIGGWTHSSTGAKPNGTNAYANTSYNPSVTGSLNSHHLSYYSRTNSNGTEVEIGTYPGFSYDLLELRTSGITYFFINQNVTTSSFSDSNSQGFYIGNRTASNVINGWKNGIKVVNSSVASNTLPNGTIFLGAVNQGGALYYSTKECAFASIGQGLTDTEAANFYTAVQAFQTTIGRSIGTQTVSDADAQAFVTAANIQDQVEANAINNLVIGLKADSLWTKMKAIYPFVGGTATTHKFNLKNPLDTDAAFRLVFSGGWTHSNTGATPNGTNAYADTYFNQTTNFTSTSNASIGCYLRTNNATTGADMGAGDTGSSRQGMLIFSSFGGTYYGCAMGDTFIAPAPTNTDSRGFYSVVRNSGIQSLHKRGNITLNVSETEAVGTITNENIWVGGGTSGGYNYSSRETAFNFIGDALTQTEIDNYYSRVQTFQTSLNRNV